MMVAFLRRIILLSLIPMAVFAATAWNMVPNESKLSFTAIQNGSPVTGEFKTFSADINFDPADLATSKVHVNVDLNSVSTSYQEVADTLKTPDWFNVKIFPQAMFDSNHFTKTGDKTYQADGTLTIRGKSLPLKLNFTIENYSANKAQVKGSTTLKRSAFNIGSGEWAKTDNVKDDVQINFAVSAVKK